MTHSSPVSALRPSASSPVANPATHPTLTPEQVARVNSKAEAALALLQAAQAEFPAIALASSLGAEDMVLTDLILRHRIGIDIFSLDTGRLPTETYDLMGEVEKHYGYRLKVYFPATDATEQFVRREGMNAFYRSVDLRKTCCAIRKVEPLKRALTGLTAWVTGLRAEQSTTRTGLPTREFDTSFGIEKFNPLADWSETEVWAYLRQHQVPTNALHERFYPSIGCAPCTRAVAVGEDIRAGRWWWEDPQSKECGLHVKKTAG